LYIFYLSAVSGGKVRVQDLAEPGQATADAQVTEEDDGGGNLRFLK
jgi:hypothetical protein